MLSSKLSFIAILLCNFAFSQKVVYYKQLNFNVFDELVGSRPISAERAKNETHYAFYYNVKNQLTRVNFSDSSSAYFFFQEPTYTDRIITYENKLNYSKVTFDYLKETVIETDSYGNNSKRFFYKEGKLTEISAIYPFISDGVEFEESEDEGSEYEIEPELELEENEYDEYREESEDDYNEYEGDDSGYDMMYQSTFKSKFDYFEGNRVRRSDYSKDGELIEGRYTEFTLIKGFDVIDYNSFDGGELDEFSSDDGITYDTRREYQDNFKLTKVEYFLKGKKLTNIDGYESKYDANGYLAEELRFDNGEKNEYLEIADQNGDVMLMPTKTVYVRNNNGYMLSETHFDKEGKLANHPYQGYASVVQTLDEAGQITKASYYLADGRRGKLDTDSRKFIEGANNISVYKEDGSLQEQYWTNEKDQIIYRNGHAIERYVIAEDGLTEMNYFDPKGNFESDILGVSRREKVVKNFPEPIYLRLKSALLSGDMELNKAFDKENKFLGYELLLESTNYEYGGDEGYENEYEEIENGENQERIMMPQSPKTVVLRFNLDDKNRLISENIFDRLYGKSSDEAGVSSVKYELNEEILPYLTHPRLLPLSYSKIETFDYLDAKLNGMYNTVSKVAGNYEVASTYEQTAEDEYASGGTFVSFDPTEKNIWTTWNTDSNNDPVVYEGIYKLKLDFSQPNYERYSFYDINGAPYLSSAGFHYFVLYSKDSKKSESYFGLKNEPVINEGGYHRVETEYDINDRLKSTFYFDKKGKKAMVNLSEDPKVPKYHGIVINDSYELGKGESMTVNKKGKPVDTYYFSSTQLIAKSTYNLVDYSYGYDAPYYGQENQQYFTAKGKEVVLELMEYYGE